jgi:hypothetical protein
MLKDFGFFLEAFFEDYMFEMLKFKEITKEDLKIK